MANIAVSRVGHLATITLNQPAKKNALNQSMWTQLAAAAKQLDADSQVRVVIIRGAEASFCAGADISEFKTVYASASAASASSANIAAALHALDNLSTPSIAAVQGPCMGGGCAIALTCDLVLADNTARFGINPTALGTAYSFRDCQRLVSRIGITHAKLMLMDAQMVSADTAVQWGLASELVAEQSLGDTITQRATQMAKRSPLALASLKTILAAVDTQQSSETAELSALYEACFHSADFDEGTAAFLAKRSPEFPGC